MATTTTSKLGLLVDPNGETLVSVQQSAWKKVDYSAGVMATVKGRDIPNSSLYPGALVAETDTGISWRCIPVGDGTYTKQYINYPYNYVAYDTSGGVGNATDVAWGWDTISSGQSVNWNASDKGSGTNSWKPPVKALYTVQMNVQFDPSNSASLRRHSWSLNNVTQSGYVEMTTAVPGITTGLSVKFSMILNVGDYIRPVFWQNSGGLLTFDTYIYAELVRPVV